MALTKMKPTDRVSGHSEDICGYNPPEFLIDAHKDALDRVENNQYAPTKGLLRLRRALADFYSPLFHRTLSPDHEIIITTGANEGILSTIMAFVSPGDEVIVLEPFFDQFVRNIRLAGGIPIFVSLERPLGHASSAGDWTVPLPKLEEATSRDKTKMLILNSPHNPSGKVFRHDELLAIGRLCFENNILILADEVYGNLCYGTERFPRMAALGDPEISSITVSIGSAGKDFAATGWRIGYVIGPEALVSHVSTAHTHICYASPSAPQVASAVGYEEAEKGGYWKSNKLQMKRKLDSFNAVWAELGLQYFEPEGGYLVLVDTGKIIIPKDYAFPEQVASRERDHKLCWFMINEVGVAALPSVGFYTSENAQAGENLFRFAVCREDYVLEEAKQRLRLLKPYIPS
ncbi:MAG: putative secondary metabolism biosynthetic enzyme [Sarcosagium campestre]|nr:MAG: putative secondary metabolism biosynthetic enzyme [Sarcosagium campestre]